MADIIGSYERSRRCENNDAVRAVAVAKRREYQKVSDYSGLVRVTTVTMKIWTRQGFKLAKTFGWNPWMDCHPMVKGLGGLMTTPRESSFRPPFFFW